MKLPSLSFLLRALFGVIRRFPLAMAAAAVGTAGVLWAIRPGYEVHESPHPIKLFMIGLLALPLFIAARAFAESRTHDEAGDRRAPAWFEWALAGGITALLAVYYVFLDPAAPGFEYTALPRYLALLIVAHLAVAVAAYLHRRAESIDDFWEYNKQLFANFVIGGAYTAILFVGLALAILAVDQLFGLDIDERNYLRLFVVLAGLFNTTLFLHRFPSTYRFGASDEAYNLVFKHLCQYILIPIVGLYFLILYAYVAKILVTWTLPHGWVSSLIIGFSTAGIFTYLLNFLLPRQDTGVASRAYRRWFWWVLLPMTILLFVAIGRRIADYGITEERYFVAATGVWLLSLCVYFIASRTDNIKFVPISLAVVILWSFFGPYNAFQAARGSQLNELELVLTRTGRWQDGLMRPGAEQLTGEEAGRIHSILTWFNQRDRLDALAPHLPVSIDSIVGSIDKRHYWERAEKLAGWLRVRTSDRPDAPAENRQVVLSAASTDHLALDVRGYTAFYQFSASSRGRERPETAGRYVTLTSDGLRLEWREAGPGGNGDKLLESFDLQPVLRNLETRGALADWGRALVPEETRYDLRGARADARLVVRETTVSVAAKAGPSFRFMSAFVFIREK